MVYQILHDEMEKKDLTIAKLAVKTGIAEKALRNKINGDTEFTWPEVCKIHRLVNARMSKDELFAGEKTNTCSIL